MKENIVLLGTLGGKLRNSVLIAPINTALCKGLPDDAIVKRVSQDVVYTSREPWFKLALWVLTLWLSETQEIINKVSYGGEQPWLATAVTLRKDGAFSV